MLSDGDIQRYWRVYLSQYEYFWLPTWTSAGVTISLTLSLGSVSCYASNQYQTPSSGHADWTLTITNGYTEMFLDPSTLGRTIGSFLSIACLGQQVSQNFTFQVDSGRVLTQSMLTKIY